MLYEVITLDGGRLLDRDDRRLELEDAARGQVLGGGGVGRHAPELGVDRDLAPGLLPGLAPAGQQRSYNFV